MYVKLKDSGSIFHDGTQDVAITGTLPKKVKSTPKIKAAIKANILEEVDEKAAKIEIEKAEKGESKTQKKSEATIEAAVNAATDGLKQELKVATEALEAKTGEYDELKEAVDAQGEVVPKADYDKLVAELNTAKEDLGKANDFIEEKGKEFETIVAEGDKLKADLDKANADLTASQDALKTTKEALAEATKKKK